MDQYPNYTITQKIEEATHWLALEDKSYPLKDITPGKLYPLVCYIEEQEYFIINDKGEYSLVFPVHRGEFVYPS